MKKKRRVRKVLTVREEVDAIRQKMRHFTVEHETACWLDTGHPLLHAVLGEPLKGLPYGKVYELSGKPSAGKSGLVMEIAASAQQNGADVAWVDHEVSWSDDWAEKRGLDPSRVALFQPQMIETKKGTRLSSAEDIYDELKMWIGLKIHQNPKAKIFIGNDSVPAIMPRIEVERGMEGVGMAHQARFLTGLLREWLPLVWTHNIMMFFINQIRTNPGKMFGDPEYEPGGNALKFYTSIKARVKRVSKGSGRLIGKAGNQIGIKGVIVNRKNKVGGLEFTKIGYKFYFNRPAKFFTYKQIKSEAV